MSETERPREGEIIFYTTLEGVTRLEFLLQDETFWLSQRRMSDLFGVEVNTINYHLKEVYKSGELSEAATIRKIRIVQYVSGLCGKPSSAADSDADGGLSAEVGCLFAVQ